MKKTSIRVLLVAISLGAIFQSCKKEEITEVTTITGTSEKTVKFKEDMRYLWSDHASYTRDVILGILDQTPDANDALARLLQNQEDIGNAIKPYYGDAAGEQLTDSLKQHIIIAGDILVAARDGNTTAFDDALAKWYANGDGISIFLNSANPSNWEIEHVKGHMKDHLDLTLAEAVAHLEGRHSDEIETYDDVFEQLMHMADMLSSGIISQFPEKF